MKEKECIYISRLMLRIIFTAVLTSFLAAGISVHGANSDFSEPNARVVINQSYTGIHFTTDLGVRHLPARATFEYLGANVFWCNDTFLGIEFDGVVHRPDFFLRSNRAYVADVIVAYISGRYVDFTPEANAITIGTNGYPPCPVQLKALFPCFTDYTEEDLMWLYRIIHAEARGEPYEAMLAVGNVVLNRRASPMYPDTVRDVIFDSRNGVQFSPTVNGAIHNTPSVASFIAAVEVLEGRQNAEGVLFFKNPQIARSSWMSRNRPFAFSLNNHDFFY